MVGTAAESASSREAVALRRLHEVITAVHSTEDLPALLATTAQGVVDVLGFGVAVVDVVEADGHVTALAVAGDEDACRTMLGRRIRLADILEEFEIADSWGSLKFVPHERLAADAPTSWVPDFEPLDVEDAWHPWDGLYAPLHGPSGRLLGVLSVDLPHNGRRPSLLGRQVLEMFAVQAGLALHHAQERTRLQERVRLAGAVHRVTTATARELDLPHVLRAALPAVVEGFRTPAAALRVSERWGPAAVDSAPPDSVGWGEAYPPEAFQGLDARLRALDPSAPRAEVVARVHRIAAEAWARGEVVVDDPSRTPAPDLMAPDLLAKARTVVQGLGMASFAIVPVGDGPECVGYLTLLRRAEDGGWSDEELEAALELGRELGRAVLRASLYARERQLVLELQQLDRAKEELFATITHELKNPLTTIRGHAGLLAAQGAAGRSVEAIGHGVERLGALVEDLLLLAKMRDPARALRPAPVDLAALVAEVCEEMAVQADTKGVELLRETGTPVCTLGEAEELRRLVTNILSNAVKYTPAGGRCLVQVGVDAGRACFTCTDTGLGVSESDLATLFDEFDRSSNPVARQQSGSGLGLAIVRRIADRHGGEVVARSVLGEGSTFGVLLPLLTPSSDARSVPLVAGEAVGAAPARSAGE